MMKTNITERIKTKTEQVFHDKSSIVEGFEIHQNVSPSTTTPRLIEVVFLILVQSSFLYRKKAMGPWSRKWGMPRVVVPV